MSKPMTWNEVCRFQEQSKQVTTLTPAQIAEAERICDEFGAGFAGIPDRVDWVKRELSEKDKPWFRPNGRYEAVQQLLGSVNPELSRRILEA